MENDIHDIDFIGYIEGNISKEKKLEIDSHLNTCPKCFEEMRLLKKSKILFIDILKLRPDLFCPETDQLVNHLAGELSPNDIARIEVHMDRCPSCKQRLSFLMDALDNDVSIPKTSQWKPLPKEILERISISKTSVRDRLKEALLVLKAKGKNDVNDLLDYVDNLADHLMDGTKNESLSYALHRPIAFPSQTDLKLKYSKSTFDLQIEIEDYLLELMNEPSGIRIKITKDGKPIEGIKIKDGGKKHYIETDSKGEVVIT